MMIPALKKGIYVVFGLVLFLSIAAAFYKYIILEDFTYEAIPVEEFESDESE
jgi:hypothetical protein